MVGPATPIGSPPPLGIPPKGVPPTDPSYRDLVKLGRLPPNWLNVHSFGASGNGNTDDSKAIQRALDEAKRRGGAGVFLPRGHYRVNSPLVMDGDEVALVGVGNESILVAGGATGDVLQVSGTNCSVRDLCISRTVARTADAGIKATGPRGWFSNLYIVRQFVGLHLYGASGSIVQGLICLNTKAGGVDLLIEGGSEYFISNLHCNSAEGKTGILIAPVGTGVVQGIRISNFSIITAGTRGIDINPGSGSVTYVHIENGDIGEQTNQAIYVRAAEGTKFVRYMTFSNISVIDSASTAGAIDIDYGGLGAFGIKIVDCDVVDCEGPGIVAEMRDSLIADCHIQDNSWAASGTYSGIILPSASCDNVRIIGCRSRGGTQNYGIEAHVDASSLIIADNDLQNNGTGALSAGRSTTNRITHNLGHVTENRGHAIVLDGNTSITVTHGLSWTPNQGDIQVTPTNIPTLDVLYFRIVNLGATTFQITVRAQPGASGAGFDWAAQIIN